jgi:hypothetical protein
VEDAVRLRQRYTTSHLAHDLKHYYEGRIDPLRDWYPLGSATAFAALADHLKGPEAEFGQLSCGCHPNCGAATMIVHNTRTDVWAPITSFFDLDRFFRDLDVVVDSARGRTLTLAQLGLAFLRNFDERKAPAGLTPKTLVELFNGKMGGSVTGEAARAPREWRITSILSMWFQDLWNYDFRRTEMCVIPYGTQEGEISFCAYNTGVGWRTPATGRWRCRTRSSVACRSWPNATAARTSKDAGPAAAAGPDPGRCQSGSRSGQNCFRESSRIVTGPWFTSAMSIIARKTPVATARPEERSSSTKRP